MRKAIVLVVLVVMVGGLATAGCGSSTTSESPKELMTKFLEGQQKGDLALLKTMMTAKSLEFLKKNEAELKKALEELSKKKWSFKITKVEKKGPDKNVVTWKGIDPSGKEGTDQTVSVVKEGGKWKVGIFDNVQQ